MMVEQRTALLLSLIVQLATFAFFSETLAFPLCAFLLALAGYYGPWHYRLNSEQRLLRGLAIALIFAAKWRNFPYSQENVDILLYLSPFLHALGQFLITLQVAALFLRDDPPWLPLKMPLLGVLVMMSAGDRSVSLVERQIFLLAAVTYICVTAIYFSATARMIAGRSARGISWDKLLATGSVLFATGIVAWLASAGLHRYERALDQIVGEFFAQSYGDSQAGFPSQSRLGDIRERKNEQADEIALRVSSRREPGYLRGRIYHWVESENNYTVNAPTLWTELPSHESNSRSERRTVAPVVQTSANDQTWYELDLSHTVSTTQPAVHSQGPKPPRSISLAALPDTPASNTLLQIWPDATLAAIYFLPVNGKQLYTPERIVRRDFRGTLSGSDVAPTTYSVSVGPARPEDQYFNMSAQASGIMSRESLVSLPRALAEDEEIQQIASDIFAGCHSPRECMNAVTLYFRKHYQYSFGIEIPLREDPVRYFLTKRPPAHCEYFAQATAALLRFQGIPTRYVTGFVAAEHNDIGDFWIARNKHAHAWCEAWDEYLGWVVVESTPPAGVPSPESSSQIRQMWDAAKQLATALRFGFGAGGWPWLIRRIVYLLTRPLGLLFLLVVGAYIAARFWMRWGRNRSSDPLDVQRLHRLLSAMDRSMARRKFVRMPGETLLCFSERLRSAGQPHAAGWYQDYAALRYEPVRSFDDIERLGERQKSLTSRTLPSFRPLSMAD